MSFNNRVLLAAAFIALAGCGGGGGGSSAAPSLPAAPAATPTPTSGSGSTLQSARLTLSFPVGSPAKSSSARKSSAAVKTVNNVIKPKFVDAAATAQLLTVINSINGNTTLPAAVQPFASTTTQLTTTGATPNCTITGGVETCNLTIAAPSGSVSYTFDAQDAAANNLSTATTTQTITNGAANSFNVVLDGIATSAAINGTVSLTAGTTSSGNLGLVIEDADNDTITGSAPFSAGSITVSSTSSHLTLALDGPGLVVYSSSVTVTDGDDASNVLYKYDGVAVANPAGFFIQVNPFVSDLFRTTNSDPTFVGLTTADASNNSVGAVNTGDPTLIFDGPGQTQNSVTASEIGFTPNTFGSGQLTIALTSPQPSGAGSYNSDGSYDATNCAAVVTALSIGAPDTSAAGNETISATSGVAGICEVTVSDGLGDSSNFYISVTTASGTIDAKHRRTR